MSKGRKSRKRRTRSCQAATLKEARAAVDFVERKIKYIMEKIKRNEEKIKYNLEKTKLLKVRKYGKG